jgi:hypothetical protein
VEGQAGREVLLTSPVGDSRGSVRHVTYVLQSAAFRGPRHSVAARVFWAVSKPALTTGAGMFRRDELRRAGTCGVGVGCGPCGHKVYLSCREGWRRALHRMVRYPERVSNGGRSTGFEPLQVARSGRFRVP